MEEKPKQVTCPCCNREITSILDFPFIKITSFESLALPDVIKTKGYQVLPLNKTIQRFFRKRIIPNPEIPEEVLQGLSNSSQVCYNGNVYEKTVMIYAVRKKGKGNYYEHYMRELRPDESHEEFESKLPDSYKEQNTSRYKPGVKVFKDLTPAFRLFLSREEEKLKTLEQKVGKTIPPTDILELFSIEYRGGTHDNEFDFSLNGTTNLYECLINVESGRCPADIHMGLGLGYYNIQLSIPIAQFTYEGLFRKMQDH